KTEHAAARASCLKALRLQPGYIAARQRLATELLALDRAAEAERLLRDTLALPLRDPRQIAALERTLGIALRQQRRFAEALTSFGAARARAPDMPHVARDHAEA